MIVIYLRHGEDKSSKHKFDQHLTSNGKRNARHLAKKLAEKYGIPNVIYCSPFYRTLKTAREMVRVLEKQGHQGIQIKIDARLGRYFSKKQRKNGHKSDTRDDTIKNGAIVTDDWKQFKERINEQLEDVKKNKEDYKVVWNVTHAIVVKQIAELQGSKKDKQVDYLETLLITTTLAS